MVEQLNWQFRSSYDRQLFVPQILRSRSFIDSGLQTHLVVRDVDLVDHFECESRIASGKMSKPEIEDKEE
jgi:hypothetical protein